MIISNILAGLLLAALATLAQPADNDAHTLSDQSTLELSGETFGLAQPGVLDSDLQCTSLTPSNTQTFHLPRHYFKISKSSFLSTLTSTLSFSNTPSHLNPIRHLAKADACFVEREQPAIMESHTPLDEHASTASPTRSDIVTPACGENYETSPRHMKSLQKLQDVI
ncbi:uncharacterized protein KD926_010507 [Aspergillus affinis]|uniref:uncharacterized protein n=1 Tax=Aspergillus affinis TaxID=1070780 RepID=UPI0022FECF89|nr:uncharacterized protein KD926_010507 [Aspergillus affinis]KAI9038667.1 hypothetical protein KD926_010507 [Aspergillus affinis]